MSALRGQPYVYVYLSSDGQPIYIGSTRDLNRRVREHRRSPWAAQAAKWVAFPYLTIDAALTDESRLIALAQPRNNRQSRRSGPSLMEMMFGLFADGRVPGSDDLRLASLLKEAKAA